MERHICTRLLNRINRVLEFRRVGRGLTHAFLIGTILALNIFIVPTTALALTKTDCLSYISGLQKRNFDQIQFVDKAIQKLMRETFNNADTFERDMEKLITLRREYVLREEFYNRLQFQIQSNYKDDELQPFLEATFQEMATTEATDPKSDKSLWKFLSFLAQAVKTTPEPHENLMAFIEGYISASTISQPKAPSEMSQQRDYTNGLRAEAAHPVAKDAVGDLVQGRIERLEKLKAEAEKAKEFSARRPVLKDPTQVMLKSGPPPVAPEEPVDAKAPIVLKVPLDSVTPADSKAPTGSLEKSISN